MVQKEKRLKHNEVFAFFVEAHPIFDDSHISESRRQSKLSSFMLEISSSQPIFALINRHI